MHFPVPSASQLGRKSAAEAIGAFAIVFAGCGAIISGRVDGLWFYVLAPVLGAVGGEWAYGAVRCGGETRGVAECC